MNEDVIDLRMQSPQVVGRDAAGREPCDHIIEHHTVSRRHARLSLTQEGILVEDLGSRFGTFVNNHRIRTGQAGESDTVQFGSGPTYRVDGGTLVPTASTVGATIELHELVIHRGGRRLLGPLSLRIEANQFTAILGPSGVGKSLLVNAIAGTLGDPHGGEIRIDGHLLDHDDPELCPVAVGIVSQQDLVFPKLSVTENLRSAAIIRLPQADARQREQALAAALKMVDLTGHQDDRVEKLSGGQRRRVSIAIELLRRPQLLILDEPTSGLDPATEARLMGVLRRVAQQGITVLCTTHTLDTLHYFDHVVALSLAGEQQRPYGSLAYNGPTVRIYPAFNVSDGADLYDRLMVGDHRLDEPDEAAARTSPLTAGGEPTVELRPHVPPPADRLVSGTFVEQAWVTAERLLLTLLRDRTALILLFVQPVALAFLVVFTQQSQTKSIYINFFLIIAALWLGMSTTVRELVRYRQHYARDRLAGLIPDSFLAGNLTHAVACCIIHATLLAASAYLFRFWMIRDPSILGYFSGLPLQWFVLLVAAMGGSVVGLMISAWAPSERVAVSLLPLAILPQMLISRVAYGDSEGLWQEQGTDLPLRLVTNIPRNLQDFLVYVASLPMISRPATSVMDIPGNQDEVARVPATEYAAEWTYLLTVCAAYLLVLYLLFRRRERSWIGLR